MITRTTQLAALVFITTATSTFAWSQPIDRHALVTRHHPVLNEFDVESPLSVGNGQFAFTADVTGLQTFADRYDASIPLGTLSQWGWHTAPNPRGWTIDDFHFKEFEAHGRMVGYADIPGDRFTPEVNYLRSNPHRLHLGRIGFRLTTADGRRVEPDDLTDIEQTLDLWNGVLVSRFRVDGQPVEVETVCHPTLDAVAVRVVSPLVARGQIAIELRFPYGTGEMSATDWSKPEAHQTTVEHVPNGARFRRQLDDDVYHVATRWTPSAELSETAPHEFLVQPQSESGTNQSDAFEFVCGFAPEQSDDDVPDFAAARTAAREHWNRFWSTGGAIDLSESRDPRWRELERRIVLSQYLTAIQCAGDYPPQESGLTFNSWYGKFHLEMHWWHAVHFALWDRLEMLERSLGYYASILPRAQGTAQRQGYEGARWPKMTDPSGAESPSTIGPFLVWQQPHPIYYAELVYRQRQDQATLEKYRDVVFETARFMASYAAWEEQRGGDTETRKQGEGASSSFSLSPHLLVSLSSPPPGRYVLGPVLQCAQERFPKTATLNPTFELTYWVWGLETAQTWRERLGLARDEKWDHVLAHLAKPPVADGKYLFTETTPDSYTNPRWNDDHPSVLGALGFLPGPGIDRPTMRRTLRWVWDHWNWPNTWGWDYPMVAMTAARVGEPNIAVDALLIDTPKNHYRRNGHNHQRANLTIYLPGNGGLLTAVAMMAAGWDGAPNMHAPGFPADDWTVRWEGLRNMP